VALPVLSGNFGDFKDFSVKAAESPVAEKFQKLIRRTTSRSSGGSPLAVELTQWSKQGYVDAAALGFG
jgi:hypothetical protein